jgi:hypothetical protein
VRTDHTTGYVKSSWPRKTSWPCQTIYIDMRKWMMGYSVDVTAIAKRIG